MIFAKTSWAALGLLAFTSAVFAQSEEQGENAADTPRSNSMIVVVGAAGNDEFKKEFSDWADQWRQLAERQAWDLTLIGAPEEPIDSTSAKDRLKAAIENATAPRTWIVLLGHGTFSRNIAKFNLVGADVSAKELADWLEASDFEAVVINGSSCSGPFMTALAGENRVVVTATRSGSELNYSRFGGFLSQAVNDASVDIDHDSEVSLLEAFLAATSRTERFYRDGARLTTEHALLDDNGDRVGTTADFYRGIRPIKASKDGKSIDGAIANRIIVLSSPGAAAFPEPLFAQRMEIERQIDRLRTRKEDMAADEYYRQLEELLLQLAHVYDQAETALPVN